jgi:hypothetical protein
MSNKVRKLTMVVMSNKVRKLTMGYWIRCGKGSESRVQATEAKRRGGEKKREERVSLHPPPF